MRGAFLRTLLLRRAPASPPRSMTWGPVSPTRSIGAVPWESLGPGDVVQIHWRSTPYKEKWVLARQGTPAAPIVVRGVPGPGGERPVIDGNGATTRLALDFASEGRGVVKIGSSSIPPDTIPKWIVIEGLHITGARAGRSFTDDSGGTQSYSANASTIYLEKGENITVRDCELTDSGNGFFVASSDSVASRDILVEGCFIHDNGNVGSIFEHNLYVAGIGMTFQYNRLGPLLPGASGNNLKDRSAGLVVRYNWIEGGNRQLDLVDGEDSGLIRTHARYGNTHVYGNVLIEPDAAGNRQLIHYGGDSGNTANYRKGTLWLYGNTMISRRTDANRTTLVRLSTSSETCDARNNLVYLPAASGTSLSLMDTDGVLRFGAQLGRARLPDLLRNLRWNGHRRRDEPHRDQPRVRERGGAGLQAGRGVRLPRCRRPARPLRPPRPRAAVGIRRPPGRGSTAGGRHPRHRRLRVLRGRATVARDGTDLRRRPAHPALGPGERCPGP